MIKRMGLDRVLPLKVAFLMPKEHICSYMRSELHRNALGAEPRNLG